MMRLISRTNIAWLAVYLLVTMATVWGLTAARRSVVQALDNPAAQQQWQQWKAETERRSQLPAGPAARRAVTSNEPPSLLLMRDYFGVIVFVIWLVETALFLFLMVTLRGSRARRDRHERLNLS